MLGRGNGLVRFKTTIAMTAMTLAGVVTAQAQNCEAKIGAMGPMSGGAAQWGLAMAGAAELAAAEVNAEGGVTIGGMKCKIVVISYDSKYTADGAAAGANALASDGIKIIIGPVGSPEATGIKPVAARNEQLSWNAAYAKNALEVKFPLVFHIAPGPATWSDAMVKHALKTAACRNCSTDRRRVSRAYGYAMGASPHWPAYRSTCRKERQSSLPVPMAPANPARSMRSLASSPPQEVTSRLTARVWTASRVSVVPAWA